MEKLNDLIVKLKLQAAEEKIEKLKMDERLRLEKEVLELKKLKEDERLRLEKEILELKKELSELRSGEKCKLFSNI